MEHSLVHQSPMMEHVTTTSGLDTTGDTITRGGLVSTILTLLGLTIMSMCGTVILGFSHPDIMSIVATVGGGVTLVLALMTVFSSRFAFNPLTSIVFAVGQGLAVGGATFGIGMSTLKDGSQGWSLVYPAVSASCAIFVAAIILFATGAIRLGHKVRSVIYTITSGFIVFYAINFVITLVFHHNLLSSGGPLSILIGVAAIIIAALNVIADLENCSLAVESHAPSRMQWGLGAALVSSLVWMYIEILRLLYIRNR